MSSRPLTSQQAAALADPGVSVALDAGAGCGKTFVLTERFLAELAAPDREGADSQPVERLMRIAAITFTDAAASELRSRIRDRCRQLRDEAAPADRLRWERVLHGLEAASISTIHAFCGALVREHAVALGVDPAYRLLEPAAARVMQDRAVEEALRNGLAESAGADDQLLELAAELELEGLASAVALLSMRANEPGFSAWLRATPADVADAVALAYREELAPAAAERLARLPLMRTLLQQLDTATPRAEAAAYFNELSEAVERFLDDPREESRLAVRPLLDSKREISGKRSFFFKVADFASSDDKAALTKTLGGLRAAFDKLKRLADREALEAEAARSLLAHRLAADAAKRYRDEKRLDGWLDYDDLLVEAHRLLTESDFADIARQIAGRLDLLLVDEFQDTDPTQTAIVRAIAGDRLATGGLFVVGDFKQSIYRFRGAQPEVFRELRCELPAAGRLPLSLNFRSQPGVIDFVNTLFGPEFGDDYEPLKAHRPQRAPRPSVEFLWTQAPEESADATRRRRAEAETIAARLRALLDAAEAIVVDERTGQPRAPRQGDFAILFRSVGQSGLYEDALRRAGLDYYVAGGQAFYAQQEIYDVVNLLAAVDSRVDEIAQFGVLRSPFFALSDETLLRLRDAGPLCEQAPRFRRPADLGPEQAAAVQRANDTLAALRAAKERVPVAELLTLAIERTGYDAALLADFLGERKLANLDKVLEQARAHDAAGGDLPGFRRQLERFVNDPPKEAPAATTTDAEDVIRLMTVHQSKGLEFPIVVLADLDRQKQSGQARAAYTPQLGPALLSPPGGAKPDGMIARDVHRHLDNAASEAEETRLFYVAATRAADQLILSACPKTWGAATGPTLSLLARRFDLTTGALLGSDEPAEPLVRVQTAPPPATKQTATPRSKLDDVLNGPLPDVAPPAALRPIIADPRATRLSVSRLNGRLSYGSDQQDDAKQADIAPPPRRSPRMAKTHGEGERLDPLGFGTLVHAVLERVADEPTPPEIQRWCENLAPAYLTRHHAAAAESATRLVRAFTASDRWRAMISAEQLRREAEFLLPWPLDGANAGRALLQGYIDAAYLDADSAWQIVDYKTNRIADDDDAIEAAAEPYRFQLGLYALAWEAATGDRPTQLILCFLQPGSEWRLDWTDVERTRAIDEVNRRLDALSDSPPPIDNPVALV